MKKKANTFADHLAKVFVPNEAHSEEDEIEVDKILDTICQLELPIKPVTPKEVLDQIKWLDSKKAPEFDLITKDILKELPKKV